MFTTNPYICNTLITNNPLVFTDSVVVDSLNWTRITGSFIADSNYTYLVIGNFFDDANTDTISFANDFTYYAYYYLDDICVSTDYSFCANYLYTGIEDESFENNVNIYPNPASNYFNVSNKDSQNPLTIRLYNTLGQKLLALNNVAEDQRQIDISDYKSGLLFIKVESKNKSFTYKLLKQ
jgi:hypothetical protein